MYSYGWDYNYYKHARGSTEKTFFFSFYFYCLNFAYGVLKQLECFEKATNSSSQSGKKNSSIPMTLKTLLLLFVMWDCTTEELQDKPM